MEENRTYSIGKVANMVGVPKYKLRHWCDRYLPEIQKIDIGESHHRRFTDRDIELIKKIKAYRDKGFTLEAAISQAREDVAGGRNRKSTLYQVNPKRTERSNSTELLTENN